MISVQCAAITLRIVLSNIIIHPSWLELLNPAFQEASFQQLKQKLLEERAEGVTHYPAGSQIFNAFNKTH